MKSFGNILIGFILVFSSCNSSVTSQQKSISKSPLVESVSSATFQANEIPKEQTQNSDCVRGQAEPIIQKQNYPNTTFALEPDSISAIETVTLGDGDKLIIRNWGCEYYVLTFRFETTKFQQDTTNLEYWYRAADRLMTGMLSGIKAPIDIKRGLVYLDSYILKDKKNKFKNLKLNDEIDFGQKEIRSFITLNSIERLTDKKFAVTISFSTGPL